MWSKVKSDWKQEQHRLDYSGFIAGWFPAEERWLQPDRDEEEAGGFLPERTDSSAAPGAVIARSGKRLQRETESPLDSSWAMKKKTAFSTGKWVRS